MACIMSRAVRLSSVAEFALADHNKSISSTGPRLSPRRCDARVTNQVLLSQTPSSVKSVVIIIIIVVIVNLHARSRPAPEQWQTFCGGQYGSISGYFCNNDIFDKIAIIPHWIVVCSRSHPAASAKTAGVGLLYAFLFVVHLIFCHQITFKKTLHAPWNNLYLIYTW